jgi:hypothetical protein
MHKEEIKSTYSFTCMQFPRLQPMQVNECKNSAPDAGAFESVANTQDVCLLRDLAAVSQRIITREKSSHNVKDGQATQLIVTPLLP